jgi:hypothetical protein
MGFTYIYIYNMSSVSERFEGDGAEEKDVKGKSELI